MSDSKISVVERPTWTQYFLEIAQVVAARATCPRKHVGAVVADADNIIVSVGYNGAPPGMPHCSESGCLLVSINGKDSCVRSLHAEENAMLFARSSLRGCTLYVTVTPCYDCAKRIISRGITRVVYAEHYSSRNTELVEELLNKAGVTLEHYEKTENISGHG